MDLIRMQQNPMVRYYMQQPASAPVEAPAQPVTLQGEGQPEQDWLTELTSGPQQSYQEASPVMRMASRASSDYTPTTGSQMEADSRSSIDKILERMQATQEANHQNDRNMQWMSFFSKLASSKNNTLLGGLGEGAEALAETTGKQQQANKLLERSALEDELKLEEWKREQSRLEAAQKATEAYQKGELGLKSKELELGKYLPIKDAFGNVTSILDARTGKIISTNNISPGDLGGGSGVQTDPSEDPQIAAQQILDEQGTPFTPVTTRQDITGRNAQAKAYRDTATAAKATKQNLDMLNAQTGKYTPGKVANFGYGAEAATGMGGEGASARAEADKAAKALANSFMQANVGAKGAGIRMVEFDAGAVPNADMPDEARTELIKKNKAIADSQIQRAAISDMYPRMHLANVNAIMDNYEAKNPPVLPDGSANPKWMTYKDWLKSGRPNTAELAMKGDDREPSGKVQPHQLTPDEARAELERRRKGSR